MKEDKPVRSVHYDAFISYRHAPLDSEVATGLHRKLEKFKLPANLKKKFPKDHRRIHRVFRDEDELPLADNLSDPIDEALRNSDWLISICSPRLPESRWCAKEVELFKQYHGQDHILCVLIEGEPDESFPEGVRYREITDENGETRREEVEPLAADVRANTPRARNKKMDDAVLRMVAPMFGLGYDDLKQRHREQRTRRIAAISLLAAAICLIFAVTATGFTVKINTQKKQIEEQHEELQEQYTEQRLKYAESMALVSKQLLKTGDAKGAIYAVLSTMPASRSDDSIPYTASTHRALSDALAIYEYDEFVAKEVRPFPKDDSFWDDPVRYKSLSLFTAGQEIICAIPRKEDDTVYLLTSRGLVYLYDEELSTMNEATNQFFGEKPEDYVESAAYKDDMLYLDLSRCSQLSCYYWKSSEDCEPAGTGSRDERFQHVTGSADEENEIESDDGKYRVIMNSDRTISLADSKGKKLRTYYDLSGSVFWMQALEGTDMYVLALSGKFSYLIDGDLNIIARIAYYYDYDPEKKALILYRYEYGLKQFELYYSPLVSYEELIEMAKKEVEGYVPSEETMERYQMLK